MELITKLADYGVSYLFLAISLYANYKLLILLLGEKEKRVEEAKNNTLKVTEPLTGLQTTLNGITVILESIVKNKP